jgi:hypothetical protein
MDDNQSLAMATYTKYMYRLPCRTDYNAEYNADYNADYNTEYNAISVSSYITENTRE